MKYKPIMNGIIEDPKVPFVIYWGNILVTLLILSPAILFTTLAVMNGYNNYDHLGNSTATWQGFMSVITLIFCIAGAVAYVIGFPFWEAKDKKRYTIYYFTPDYLHIELYKEAYEECLADIKAGAFNEDEWDRIFTPLNAEAKRFEENNKKLKEQQKMPKKDYALAMRTFNDTYFKDLK